MKFWKVITLVGLAVLFNSCANRSAFLIPAKQNRKPVKEVAMDTVKTYLVIFKNLARYDREVILRKGFFSNGAMSFRVKAGCNLECMVPAGIWIVEHVVITPSRAKGPFVAYRKLHVKKVPYVSVGNNLYHGGWCFTDR